MNDLLDKYAPVGIDPAFWIDPWLKTIPDDTRGEFLARRNIARADWRKAEFEAVELRDTWPRMLADMKECACGGCGWIVSPFPLGHPDHNRFAICFCKRDDEIKRQGELRWLASGLTAGDRQPTFLGYEIDESDSHMLAKRGAVEWSQERASDWLLLVGASGTGKTHLAKAATVAILGAQRGVLYATATELAEAVRTAQGEGTEYVDMVQRAMRAETLILDDLGREYQTTFWVDRLHRIIDYRSDRNLPTMVTSNHSIEELVDMFGPPLVSRLRQGETRVIIGKDRRTEEKA